MHTSLNVFKLSERLATQPISERIYNGDQSAETELAETYRDNMLRTIGGQVRSAECAFDLLHDALLAAILALRSRSLDEPEKLENFLMRIAKYTVTNYLRCKNGQIISQASDDIDSLASSHSPAAVYAQWRRREFLERMINSLKVPRDRGVAERFYLLEESKSSICSELGLSKANFDSIHYRIKRRIEQLATRDQSV